MHLRHTLLLICLTLLGGSMYAQDRHAVERALREGNAAYRKDSVADAAAAYQRAGGDQRGTFNLGNAQYRQQQYEQAKAAYEAAAAAAGNDPTAQARAYHNLGNSMLQLKKPEEAIKSYKEALKRNPADEDTRYNLAYAQRLLQQQQEQQNKQDQQKDQEQKKDDQQQDQKQEQEQKEQEQRKNQQQDRSQAQQRPGQIDKRDAQRILDQLDRQEKDLQERMRRKAQAAVRVPIEKDW